MSSFQTSILCVALCAHGICGTQHLQQGAAAADRHIFAVNLTILSCNIPFLVASGSHFALWSAAEVLTAPSSEHSFQSELSDLMSARQEWHATLDDVLEGTHDDLEAIMISARCGAIDSAVMIHLHALLWHCAC